MQDATIAPLEGKPVPDLASHFTAAAAPGAAGRRSVTRSLDADLPRATGRVTPTLQPVNLHALADAGGAIDLVGSTLDLTVQATRGRADRSRSTAAGELMFTRDGGTWKILSFQLAVTRDGAGLGTATATSSTTKAGS